MPRMTSRLFGEILESVQLGIETLEMEKAGMDPDAEGFPTLAERAAIDRVEQDLKRLVKSLKAEIHALG